MVSFSTSAGTLAAVDGLRQSQQAQLAAIKAIGSGSLDMDTMAQAAAVLKGAQTGESAAALALKAQLDQQGRFIDILA